MEVIGRCFFVELSLLGGDTPAPREIAVRWTDTFRFAFITAALKTKCMSHLIIRFWQLMVSLMLSSRDVLPLHGECRGSQFEMQIPGSYLLSSRA